MQGLPLAGSRQAYQQCFSSTFHCELSAPVRRVTPLPSPGTHTHTLPLKGQTGSCTFLCLCAHGSFPWECPHCLSPSSKSHVNVKAPLQASLLGRDSQTTQVQSDVLLLCPFVTFSLGVTVMAPSLFKGIILSACCASSSLVLLVHLLPSCPSTLCCCQCPL